MEERKVKIAKLRAKLNKFQDKLEKNDQNLKKLKDKLETSKIEKVLKQKLKLEEKETSIKKSIEKLEKKILMLLSSMFVREIGINDETNLKYCCFFLESLEDISIPNLIEFYAENSVYLGREAADIIKTLYPLGGDEQENIQDEIVTLTFLAGLYYPNLSLPKLEDIEPKPVIPDVPGKLIYNFSPFCGEKKFIEAFNRDGLQRSSQEVDQILQDINKDYKQGKEFWGDINGELKPCAYKIHLPPNGEIKSVVISAYGGRSKRDYDSLINDFKDYNKQANHYISEGIAYVELFTPDYTFDMPQTERTKAEMHEVLTCLEQFKKALPEICLQLSNLPVYFKGGSFGAITGVMYAMRHKDGYDDFDGYILQCGLEDRFENLPPINLKGIKKPVFIMGNILDNNLLLKSSAEIYVQADKQQKIYFIPEKSWTKGYIPGVCAKSDDEIIYPKTIIMAGHRSSDTRVISVLQGENLNKDLGFAQALYAILNYNKQNSIAKYFDIYTNSNTRNIEADWNLQYGEACKAQYLIDSFKTNEDIQSFVGSLKSKVTDEMLVVIVREYLRGFISYNKMAYVGEFVTEEELNRRIETLSNPENIFFKTFKEYFASLGESFTEEEVFSAYSKNHTDHILGLLLKNFPALMELSPKQQIEFIHYECNKKKEFKQDIERYINALNDCSLPVLCGSDRNAYILKHWRLSGAVTGIAAGVVVSGALISGAVIHELANNAVKINIYFSHSIQNAMHNLITQDNSNPLSNILRSNEFAITICAAAITLAVSAAMISISCVVIHAIKHSYDSKLQDYVNNTLQQGLPAKLIVS